jgi:hypothetical protein
MLMANKRKKFSPEEKVGLLRLHATGYITPKDKLAGRTEIIPARRESKLAAAREARKAKRKASPTIRPRGVGPDVSAPRGRDFALLKISQGSRFRFAQHNEKNLDKNKGTRKNTIGWRNGSRLCGGATCQG